LIKERKGRGKKKGKRTTSKLGLSRKKKKEEGGTEEA